MKVIGFIVKSVLVCGLGLGSALLAMKGINWWLFGPEVPNLLEMDSADLLCLMVKKGMRQAVQEHRVEEWLQENPEFLDEVVGDKLFQLLLAKKLTVAIKKIISLHEDPNHDAFEEFREEDAEASILAN